MSYSTDEPQAPRLTPAVQALIAINVAIFFLQLTVVSASDMTALLGFHTGDLSRTWWTVVTYMFVHAGFWHLALNMYTLFLFGPRVEREWSGAEFTRYYLLCGLGGLLLHLLFWRGSALVGASAAIYGVMLAYARRWPDDEVYLFAVLPIKVKWFIALLVLMDLVNGVANSPGHVAHFAHLGGFLTGWLYLRVADATRGDGLRAHVSSVPDYDDSPPRAIPRSLPRPRPRGDEVDDVVAKSKAALAQRPSFQVAPPTPRPTLAASTDLDQLLDKISQHGLESLTADERRMLEEASRRMRGE
ncbi:MAG TPA: rhomboid family intramembrane serine protease [Gemmatimonadaceae bacterium]|nr:rhomboid family intramembrane serine protease [Gemmatimonadaceae bacterium]